MLSFVDRFPSRCKDFAGTVRGAIRQARANKAVRPYQIKNAKAFPSKGEKKKSYAIDRPFRTYFESIGLSFFMRRAK
jgi:hypothetical protein